MPDPTVRLLLVEDDEDDALLAREALAEVPHCRFEVTWCPSFQKGIEALATPGLQVCLLDHRLGADTGLEFLERAGTMAPPPPPIILLTGSGNRELDLQAMELGAADYLDKASLTPALLDRAIRYALERRRHMDELTRQNRVLAELVLLRNRLLGMAAHDLRNPLGVIRLAAEILGQETLGPLNPQQKKLLSEVEELADYMASMVNDTLDLSRIETGQLNLRLESTHIRPLVERNLAMNSHLADRKQIHLSAEFDGEMGPIRADGGKIIQVLDNLVSNAIKYSDPGTAIQVSVQGAGDQVELRVADQGRGISPEQLGRLFEPFARGETRPTGGERSSGLGLAIVQRIVEGHGGRIEVTSCPGEGSTFVVFLPVEGPGAAEPLQRTTPGTLVG
jgi:signal transduction histidine kinase